MTDQEHTNSLRARLDEAKAELKEQDQVLEDLEALMGREAHGRVVPGQMRAAEAAFDKALGEAPELAPIRPALPREELRIPSFALFA
ncbi:MAG: hypothetical protein ACI9KE_004706 [Polyangiales bacterium]|jgi:hypothetical protein